MPLRDRLRLSWELTWPLAAIDFTVVLLLHGMFDVEGETFDSLWALAAFFVVSPWVIRRAFRKTYGGRRIGVVRVTPGELRYQESLKIMWLLAWRAMVLSLAAVLLLSLLLRTIGISARSLAVNSALANSLGLSMVDFITSIAFTPLLIPGMLKKRYRGFRLETTEIQPASIPVAKKSARSADKKHK